MIEIATLMGSYLNNWMIAIPGIFLSYQTGKLMASYSYNATINKTLDAIMYVVRSLHYSSILLFCLYIVSPNVLMQIVDLNTYRDTYLWFSIYLSIMLTYSFYIRNHFKVLMDTVDKEQITNARYSGISEKDITKKILMPQAARNGLTSFVSEFSDLFKSTVVPGAYGFNELLSQAMILGGAKDGNYFLYFISVIVLMMLGSFIVQTAITWIWKEEE